jgi:hypothetical protein
MKYCRQSETIAHELGLALVFEDKRRGHNEYEQVGKCNSKAYFRTYHDRARGKALQ